MSKLRFITLVSLVLIHFFVFASSVWAKNEYTVGAILPLSGSLAGIGKIQKRTLLMLADVINRRAGIKGNALKIQILDSQGLLPIAVMGTRELILEKRAAALISPSTTQET